MTPPFQTSQTVFAPAKLNLFLHVVGRQPDDGLHRLESLFVFLSVGDRLTFSPAHGFDLRMTPDLGVPRDQNLAWRALDGVRASAPDLPAVSIKIEKCLPAEAGLGGGTANAAAVVHWAENLRPDVEFRSTLAGLGADMPPALDQQSRLWSGTGDEPGRIIHGLKGTSVLLLKPPTGVSTGACFSALGGVFSPKGAFSASEDLQTALKSAQNDLEGPAKKLNPDIAEALERLSAFDGTWLVRMTGSGSTCFALFHEKGPRDAALDQLIRDKPTWWSAAAEIL